MKLYVLVCVLAVLTLSMAAYSEPARAPEASRVEFQAQLQNIESQVHAQIQTLEAQMDAADPDTRETLNRQIMELKRQGEIQRLEVLLQWAQADGDAARTAEIEQALAQWRTPPQTHQLPQVPKSASPGSSGTQPAHSTSSN